MSKYTDWVRSLPCCITQHVADDYMGVDPHHIKGYNWLTQSGGSKKGSDLAVIPLRHDLHVELHDIGWASFEKKYNINQVEEVLRVLLQAEREGVLSI